MGVSGGRHFAQAFYQHILFRFQMGLEMLEVLL